MPEPEDRLAAIIRSASDAIVGFSLDGVIESWNRGAELTYGYTLAEISGRPHAVLCADEEITDFLAVTGDAFETGRLRKDGTRVLMSVKISPVLDKNSQLIGFSEVAREVAWSVISERDAAQLAAIVDSSDDAIIGKSIEKGIIQSWNRGAERLYGYSAEEVIGMPMSSLMPDSLLEQEQTILAKVRQGERVENFDTIRIHKDGTAIPVSLTMSPIRNAGGEIIGVSHVARDITETKRLKDRMQVSQKMEALGRLAGGVAHDFNNLLTVISGYGALLQQSLKNDADCLDMANEVMGAAKKAAELTRQLLTFSRNQVVHLQAVDLNQSITQILGMLRRLIGEDISIETKLGAGLSEIEADPGQIGQVLMNLATNARDAMPGGGKITIQTDSWVVESDEFSEDSGFAPGRYVRMVFSDTGQGMDSQTQARVFEPFFTTKEKGKGTGLGLSTVYGIVKQSGGQINIYSEVGRGTAFRIYFRCASTHAAVTEPVAVGARHGSETILLVEDEPGIRKLALSVLKANGYSVLAAANAKEAVVQAENYAGAIQLLVTDIVMPGESGKELASRVTGMRPDIRVVFMSGYTEHAILEDILSDPDAAFLQKPFTPDQLLQRIREVLDAKS